MNHIQKIGDQPIQEGSYTPTRTRATSVIIVRFALTVLALGGSLGFIEGATAKTAKAAGALVYTIDPNTAAGGVFARSDPHTNDTQRIAGYGVYPNQTVVLLCGVTDGYPVGPYNNTTWHFVEDLSNPGEGNFWLNDHYIQSPNIASQLAPSESTCPNESSDPMQATSGQQTATHLPCTPLLLIGVRGSGQSYGDDGNGVTGFGSTLAPIAHALTAYYGSNTITTFGLPYTAAPANRQTILESSIYLTSEEQGRVFLLSTFANQVAACPQQVIELIGYSQGAEAIMDAVSTMNTDSRAHIGGIVVFGEPQFNPYNSEDRGTFLPEYNGVLGPRPVLPQDITGKVQSYCNLGDAICNFSAGSLVSGNFGHATYGSIVSIQASLFLELLHPVSSL